MRRAPGVLAGVRRGPSSRAGGPLRVKVGPWLRARRKTGISVIPLRGAEFGQKPEQSWQQVLSAQIKEETQPRRQFELSLVGTGANKQAESCCAKNLNLCK